MCRLASLAAARSSWRCATTCCSARSAGALCDAGNACARARRAQQPQNETTTSAFSHCLQSTEHHPSDFFVNPPQKVAHGMLLSLSHPPKIKTCVHKHRCTRADCGAVCYWCAVCHICAVQQHMPPSARVSGAGYGRRTAYALNAAAQSKTMKTLWQTPQGSKPAAPGPARRTARAPSAAGTPGARCRPAAPPARPPPAPARPLGFLF